MLSLSRVLCRRVPLKRIVSGRQYVSFFSTSNSPPPQEKIPVEELHKHELPDNGEVPVELPRFLSNDSNDLNRWAAENLESWITPLRPVLDPIESYLHAVHDHLGLPWWASIMLVAFTARCTMLPVMVWSHRARLRMLRLGTARKTLQNWYRDSILPAQSRLALYNELNMAQNAHYGLSLYKFVLPVVAQVAGIVLVSLACRLHIFSDTVAQAGGGGVFWAPDLSLMDPYYILPAITIALTYFNMSRYVADLDLLPEDVKHPLFHNLREHFRVAYLLVCPIYGFLASGVFFYLIPSALFSALQRILSAKRIGVFQYPMDPLPLHMPSEQWPNEQQPPTSTHNPFHIAEAIHAAQQKEKQEKQHYK